MINLTMLKILFFVQIYLELACPLNTVQSLPVNIHTFYSPLIGFYCISKNIAENSVSLYNSPNVAKRSEVYLEISLSWATAL